MILLRKRIFIACEGESEESFVKWLQQLCDDQELSIHLDSYLLRGGGYEKMLSIAIEERNKRRSKAGSAFKQSVLFVDTDRGDSSVDVWSLENLRQAAFKSDFFACFSRPNLEGVLLRMLLPKAQIAWDSKRVEKELHNVWEKYKKPATADILALKFRLDKIDPADAILRVAQKDPDIQALLSAIGFKNK